MLKNFSEIYEELRRHDSRKRMVVAWGVDAHTISAAGQAVEMGLADVTLVGDKTIIEDTCRQENICISSFSIVHEPVEREAISRAVRMVRDGQGDFLMKGLCSTDKFLRAVLDKEAGLLPPKGTLTHCGVIELPQYHKLLFVGDVAVIPAPDLRQKQFIAECLVKTARALGVQTPKVAFIAATEQILSSQPATQEAALLAKMAERGQIKGCVADGPLALDVAIDAESVAIKGITGPVAGDADCLLFPNIESGNVFYKSASKLVRGTRQAGVLLGAVAPCVLSSRADTTETKLNSIAIAAMSVCK